jgi:hypothetical protein
MSSIYSANIFPQNADGALRIIGQQRQPLSSLYAVHYLFTGADVNVAADISIPGASNWTSQYPTTLAFSANSSATMVTFDSTGTYLNFPVSGIYNITFRFRPLINSSSGTTSGHVITPYILKKKYMGVTFTGNTVANRLCQQEKWTGAIASSNNYNSRGEGTLDHTGLFLQGDQVALYVSSTSTTSGLITITKTATVTGTRFLCSLIQPMSFATAPNVSKTFYASVTFNLPSAASGRTFNSVRFFVGTTDVTALAVASAVGVTGATTNAFTGNPLTVAANVTGTLTATFPTPQAITSIVYVPSTSICTSWGVSLTFTDMYGISALQTPVISSPSIGTGLGSCTQYSTTASGTNSKCTYTVGSTTNNGTWTYTA